MEKNAYPEEIVPELSGIDCRQLVTQGSDLTKESRVHHRWVLLAFLKVAHQQLHADIEGRSRRLDLLSSNKTKKKN
jgi:hypothetical protein